MDTKNGAGTFKDGRLSSVSPTSSSKSRPKGLKISRNHKQIYGRTKRKHSGLESFSDLRATLSNQMMGGKHVAKGQSIDIRGWSGGHHRVDAAIGNARATAEDAKKTARQRSKVQIIDLTTTLRNKLGARVAARVGSGGEDRLAQEETASMQSGRS